MTLVSDVNVKANYKNFTLSARKSDNLTTGASLVNDVLLAGKKGDTSAYVNLSIGSNFCGVNKFVFGLRQTNPCGGALYADLTKEKNTTKLVPRLGLEYQHKKNLTGKFSLVNLKCASVLATYQLNDTYGAGICLNKDLGTSSSDLKYGLKIDFKC